MVEAGRQLFEGDREDRRREQALEGILGALAVEGAAPRADHPLPAEHRGLEEGKPAYVVEMQVAEEDIDFARRR